jgi:TfoX/Sxy family transcriptional regulator of competence genes
MAWVKIPKENQTVFEAALPLDERIEVKSMFGGIAAMLNGQMLGGLFGTTAIVKLGAERYAALRALGGKPFDPMENGRVMSSAFVLPQAEFDDRARLRAWLREARDHVASLPAKPEKTTPATKKAVSAKADPAPTSSKKASPEKARPKKASPKR